MTAKKQNILWVDLEMTGLEPGEDKILEVAAIVTDWNFIELATYESSVRVDDEVVAQRLENNAVFWDENPEARDGLLAQNAAATKTATQVEGELLALCDEWFSSDERVLLAGNSIHQDRRFIRAEWAKLDKRLHYRMLDVSAWKVVFEGKYDKKFCKPEEHRALSDIRGSIMELKYYLSKVKQAS